VASVIMPPPAMCRIPGKRVLRVGALCASRFGKDWRKAVLPGEESGLRSVVAIAWVMSMISTLHLDGAGKWGCLASLR